MKLTMRPLSKSGYTHKIVDETIKANAVALDDSGLLTIALKVGPIDTSGNFRGSLTLSLSELHQLLGIAEEQKIKLLKENHKMLKELSKKV